MKRIGVQKELSNVADFLTSQGYSVQMLSETMESNTERMDTFDAIITAGYNDNMMGCSDCKTKVPVIDANGLTPEDVKRLVDKQVNR